MNKLLLALHNVYFSFRSTTIQLYHTLHVIVASNFKKFKNLRLTLDFFN